MTEALKFWAAKQITEMLGDIVKFLIIAGVMGFLYLLFTYTSKTKN